MKACPNAQCPHRLQTGAPAAYLPTSVLCRHCAGRVVPVEELERAERAAPTLPSANRRPTIGEGWLFFLGLGGVVIPHFLAQALHNNLAYALPLVVLAFALTRMTRRGPRSSLDTTVVEAVRMPVDVTGRRLAR